MQTCFVIWFLLGVASFYPSLADVNIRSKRYVPQPALYRVLSLAETMQNEPSLTHNAMRSKPLFVSRNIDHESYARPSVFTDDDDNFAEVNVAPPATWYLPLKNGHADFLGYSFRGPSAIEKGKRFFDSLGGSEVHGFKRSVPDRLHDALKGFREHMYDMQLKRHVKNTYQQFIRANDRVRRGASVRGKLAETLTQTDDGLWKHPILRRALDSLGGYQVHGWKRDDDKRALDSLGGYQVHGWKRDDDKRALDSLGGYQVHGWKRDDDKRALDSLGGYQVHGWKRDDDKRALDSLGGYQVHGWKRDDDKRALDSLGGYQVHGWKRDDDKRALDSLGGYQVHGWKKRSVNYDSGNGKDSANNNDTKGQEDGKGLTDGTSKNSQTGVQFDKKTENADDSEYYMDKSHLLGSQFQGSNYEKRALDSLGGYQVHGWKRDDDKRALDSLGGYQVHGWKRDDDKRALDSLGGYQVHGWKRDDDKRALDSLGGYQVHGWKRRDTELETYSKIDQDKRH